MSPYQSQVIDATLSEFDKSRLAGQQQIRDAAVGSGNFGGGREGAMMGQYNADSLADRSALTSFKCYNKDLVKHNKQPIKTLLINKDCLLLQNQQNLSQQGLAGALW